MQFKHARSGQSGTQRPIASCRAAGVVSRRAALTGAAATMATVAAGAGMVQAQAPRPSDIVRADVLRGWRNPDGTRMAALRLQMAPGWKTYWRMPGAAGIAPRFDWSRSRNVASVRLHWPRPEIFDQSGLLGLGYGGTLVLPVEIVPRGPGRVMLAVQMDIGACRDICVPLTLDLRGTLAGRGAADSAISDALDQRPETATEAGVRAAHCRTGLAEQGLDVRVAIDMPPLGGREVVVFELPDDDLWITPNPARREGGRLVADARIMSGSGAPVMLDRSDLQISVIASNRMVEIAGCSAG